LNTDPKYYAVAEATWPAAQKHELGPITLRNGMGGGSRVSAATVRGQVTTGDLSAAEAAMREMGQAPLFMVRDGEDALDAMLDESGYIVKDPVNLWSCPAAQLSDAASTLETTYSIWDPLEIQREIWASAGFGLQRLAVMDRVKGAKTALLGRKDDKPAGAGFCAIHDGVAMVHALEILPFQRRKGMAGEMMQQAAFWALENGADTLAVLCTKGNEGANGLYGSLGMTSVGQYHYRILPNGD